MSDSNAVILFITDDHMHLLDAVLESVMVFRLAAGGVAEVVVPLGLAKAGFLSGCTVVLGIVAATEERSEDWFYTVYGSTVVLYDRVHVLYVQIDVQY